MGPALLIFVGVIYCAVAYSYFLAGRYGMCLAFAAYAVANWGFAWDMWR